MKSQYTPPVSGHRPCMWPERRGICFPALPDRGELLTEHALLFQKSSSSEVRQHRSQPKRKRQTCENNDCRIHARATLTMCGKPRFLISGVDTHQTRCAISRRLQNLVTTPEIKNRGFIRAISFCATVLVKHTSVY